MTSLLSILLLLFTIASCLALAQSQQCSPSLIRIRKEIHDLSDAEWRRFLVALGQLKRRPSILFNNRGRRGRRGEGSGERPDRRRPPPDNDDDNDDANNNSNRRPGRGETGDDGDDSNWPSPNGWTRPETGADGVGKNSTQINRASGLLKCSAARIRQTLHDLRSTPTFEAGMLSDQLSDTYDSLLESIGALAAAPFPLFGNDSATGNKTVERDGGQQCETLLQSALEQAPDPRFFSLDDFSALHRANRLRA
jgi:hypothetical protein